MEPKNRVNGRQRLVSGRAIEANGSSDSSHLEKVWFSEDIRASVSAIDLFTRRLKPILSGL
jgi:hypothetical protein